MDILKEIQNRFTPRHFDGRGLDKAVLDRILEAGRLAPSAKNRQAWRFVAITKQEKKDQLKNFCYGEERVGTAAAVVASCTTNIEYRMPNGQFSYPIDLAIATSFMMIQAQKEGAASVLLTTYDEAGVKGLLTVPHAMRVVMLLLLGHTQEQNPPSQRLDTKRVISFDHW